MYPEFADYFLANLELTFDLRDDKVTQLFSSPEQEVQSVDFLLLRKKSRGFHFLLSVHIHVRWVLRGSSRCSFTDDRFQHGRR